MVVFSFWLKAGCADDKCTFLLTLRIASVLSVYHFVSAVPAEFFS